MSVVSLVKIIMVPSSREGIGTHSLDREIIPSKKQITVVDHPPYSADLAPCDFWLFLRLKSVTKETHFDSVDEIEKTVTSHSRTLSKSDFISVLLKVADANEEVY